VCALKKPVTAPQDDGSPAPPNLFRSSLVLYFLLLATTLGAVLADWEALTVSVTLSIVDSLIVLIALLLCRRQIVSGLLHAGRARWYFVAVGLAPLTYAMSDLSVSFLTRVFDAEEILYTPPFLEAGYGLPWIILAVCVQPAVFEEIAFRGIVFSGMLQILDRKDAVLVSSLLFMTIHLTVLSFPHLFVIGLALGYLRLRTGSFYPGMVLHFAHNLLCVVSEL
jgi:hypothetical protein